MFVEGVLESHSWVLNARTGTLLTFFRLFRAPGPYFINFSKLKSQGPCQLCQDVVSYFVFLKRHFIGFTFDILFIPF